MNYIKWVLLISLAAVLGFLVVEYLAVHPLEMNTYLPLSAIFWFAIAVLLTRGFAMWFLLLIALVMIIIAFFAGYYSRMESFLAREDDWPVPKLFRSKDDQGDRQTAVVYSTYGESEIYDPIGWINQFNEFGEQGVPFVSVIARSLFVHQ